MKQSSKHRPSRTSLLIAPHAILALACMGFIAGSFGCSDVPSSTANGGGPAAPSAGGQSVSEGSGAAAPAGGASARGGVAGASATGGNASLSGGELGAGGASVAGANAAGQVSVVSGGAASAGGAQAGGALATGGISAMGGASGTANGGSSATSGGSSGCNPPTTVSFQKDVQAFLGASCGGGNGCHVVDAASTMSSGGYNHAYDWITGGAHPSSCPGGPMRFEIVLDVIKAANPASCSHSRQMPPPGSKPALTACQVATLQAWLNEPRVTQKHRPDDSSPTTSYPMPPFN